MTHDNDIIYLAPKSFNLNFFKTMNIVQEVTNKKSIEEKAVIVQSLKNRYQQL